jgi:type IV pilus assembly protein PilC
MIFSYKVIDVNGTQQNGDIEAISKETALQSLLQKGYFVESLEQKSAQSKLEQKFGFLGKVPMRDVVILSRQISTLFEAQVTATKAFNLLASTTTNIKLREALQAVSQDIQGGLTIAGSMQKHPEVFSTFYVNMVSAGEEAGKLNEVFLYLADYLERQHEITSKTRSAMIYPAFIILTFFGVNILMLTKVTPKLTNIIKEAGIEIPFYTKITMGMSDFLINYGIILLIFAIILIVVIVFMAQSEAGKQKVDEILIGIPYVGDLMKKIYLARISDNISTMLSSGIPVVRTLEITASVVGNYVYKTIMIDSANGVKTGLSISQSLAKYPKQIPEIMTQMISTGEETGSMGKILKTLSSFYKREVSTAVDTMVDLIEPVMIIFLGVSVGFLLTSVIVPMYQIASKGFQ